MPNMEKDLNSKSAEELFLDYIETIYKLKPGGQKFDALVAALRDAFFAGMAIASVSEQDFKHELMVYAENASRNLLGNMNKEGWVN